MKKGGKMHILSPIGEKYAYFSPINFMEQQQHGLVIQRRGRVVRLQKSAKSLPSALQLMSSSQINNQKHESGHFDLF